MTGIIFFAPPLRSGMVGHGEVLDNPPRVRIILPATVNAPAARPGGLGRHLSLGKTMRTLIIGGGAIGCMLSARMAAAGHSVTLLARPTTVAAVQTDGLRLTEANGRTLAPPVAAAASLSEALASDAPWDLAVVAVKAYDTAALAGDLQGRLPADLPVLSVQNGVGNEATLAAALASPVLAGALTTPVKVVAPGHVQIARASHKAAVAPWRGPVAVEPVAGLLRSAGFSVQVFDDGVALKWSKLLMNILANAQPAILGYTPAQVFAQPALGNLEVRAWQEALAVLRALGIRLLPVGGYPLPLLAPLVRRLPASLVRPVMGRWVAGGRGNKLPSLTYDLIPRPRGRSEVAWLNGAVAREADALGLPAPVNATFTRVLLDLVENRSPVEAWANRPDRLLAAVAEVADN